MVNGVYGANNPELYYESDGSVLALSNAAGIVTLTGLARGHLPRLTSPDA